MLSISPRHPSPFPPISHLCPSGPYFSQLPLPSSFRTRLFLFSSRGSLHRKLYTLGAFRKAERSFPVSSRFGHIKKKKYREEESNYLTRRETQVSAVLTPLTSHPSPCIVSAFKKSQACHCHKSTRLRECIYL